MFTRIGYTGAYRSGVLLAAFGGVR